MGLWLFWLWVPLGLAEEETLLDTRLETSDLHWTVHPQGEGQWEELSALDAELGGAVRTFEVCSGRGRPGAPPNGRDPPQPGRDPPPQNSWLRSRWVPRGAATTVLAEIRFTVMACDSLGRTRGTRGTRDGDSDRDRDSLGRTRGTRGTRDRDRDSLGRTRGTRGTRGTQDRDRDSLGRTWGTPGDNDTPGDTPGHAPGPAPGNSDALDNGGLHGNNPKPPNLLGNDPDNHLGLRGNGIHSLHLHGNHPDALRLQSNDPKDHNLHGNNPKDIDLRGNHPNDHSPLSNDPDDLSLHGNDPTDPDLHGNDPDDLDLHGNDPEDHYLHDNDPDDLSLHGNNPTDPDLHGNDPKPLDLHGNHHSSPSPPPPALRPPRRPRSPPGPARPCKETFGVFYHESDADTATATSPPWMENPYVKVDTVAAEHLARPGGGPGGPQGRVNRKVLRLGPLSRAGFYVAFQDLGACMALLSVRLFFRRCPAATARLARFPATVPAELVAPVAGACVAGAVPAAEGVPLMYCREDGRWAEPPALGCVCGAGMEPSEGAGCRPCPPETFKAEPGGGSVPALPPPERSPLPRSPLLSLPPRILPSSRRGTPGSLLRPPLGPPRLGRPCERVSCPAVLEPPAGRGGPAGPAVPRGVPGVPPPPRGTPPSCGPCGPLAWAPPPQGLRTPAVSVAGLRPRVTYSFRVSARSGVTPPGPPEPPAAEINITAGADVPPPVSDVVRVGGGPGGVTLAWPSPPPGPPGPPRAGLRGQVLREGGEGAWGAISGGLGGIWGHFGVVGGFREVLRGRGRVWGNLRIPGGFLGGHLRFLGGFGGDLGFFWVFLGWDLGFLGVFGGSGVFWVFLGWDLGF
uniref:Uncharacterized protein n=1 Tax=Corvus moneduloides TaxID=1196302 RepID=A0A8U7NSB8_CORMO